MKARNILYAVVGLAVVAGVVWYVAMQVRGPGTAPSSGTSPSSSNAAAVAAGIGTGLTTIATTIAAAAESGDNDDFA